MSDSLEDLYSALARRVPERPKREFEFTSAILPVPAEHMETDQLVIKKVVYRYGGYYQVDQLWFYAKPETYRHLALLILANTFHVTDSPIRLDLIHPASDIKQIMLKDSNTAMGWRNFYFTRPARMLYYTASAREVHHRQRDNYDQEDAIFFRLSNLENDVSTDEEYAQRDVVWLDGNDRARITLAEMLLNIGRKSADISMKAIASSGRPWSFLGFWSAEVRFHLPGFPFWPEEITLPE